MSYKGYTISGEMLNSDVIKGELKKKKKKLEKSKLKYYRKYAVSN